MREVRYAFIVIYFEQVFTPHIFKYEYLKMELSLRNMKYKTA